MQKEKVDIDYEGGAQVSILVYKIATQVRSPNKLSITFIFYFLVIMFTLRCVADLIKKLELSLMVVSVLLKIEFGYTQISVVYRCRKQSVSTP